MATFDFTYQNILKDIRTRGTREKNQRTKHETMAIPGVSFSHDIEKDGFPLITLRKIPVTLFIAEQMWFISGSRRPDDFLREYTKVWDGFTNPGNVVTVAYGYRWRRHFGRDQLANLVSLLEKDSSSRHGVIITWDASSDGLGGISRKNVPCPYTFTVNIIGGRLNLHNIVRSNDMILGFPSDVAGFALLQLILAERLGVSPGIYTHSISNAHVYDIHYPVMDEIIKRKPKKDNLFPKLPKNTYARAEKKDRKLAEELILEFTQTYKPLPPITGLKIVF